MEFERLMKRLVILLVASLVVIFIAKMLLSKAATNLGRAAADKKAQATTSQAVATPLAASQPIEQPQAAPYDSGTSAVPVVAETANSAVLGASAPAPN